MMKCCECYRNGVIGVGSDSNPHKASFYLCMYCNSRWDLDKC